MSVHEGSRYVAANQIIVNATTSAFPNRGNLNTIYTPPVIFKHAPYRRYQTRQGDTFWKIADQILGGAKDWWRIADMNPQIFYPDNITPGTVIRVPVV